MFAGPHSACAAVIRHWPWFLAVPVLGAALGTFSAPLWFSAAGLLRNEAFFQGKPTGYWLRLLVDEDPAARAEAAENLRNGGAKALSVLREGAANPDPAKAAAAAVVLVRSGHGTAPAVLPVLIHGLQVGDPEVRKQSAHALGLLGPRARGAAPALEQALEDDSARVRVWAAWALCVTDERESPAAFRVLDSARRHHNFLVRFLAAQVMDGLSRRGVHGGGDSRLVQADGADRGMLGARGNPLHVATN